MIRLLPAAPLPAAPESSAAVTTYLDGATVAMLVGGMIIALIQLIAGLNGHAPGRKLLALTWLLQAGVVAYTAMYAVRLAGGESSVGPLWELWAYLITVLLLPALAVLWAREEPSRWSTIALSVAAFTVAVMAARCAQIWVGVGFTS